MPRKKIKALYYIYKITCTVTDKFYIGMHKQTNETDNYMGSGRHLANSKRKHGIDNHIKEILEYLPDLESLKVREKEIINEDLLKDPMCMNIQPGGGGGFSVEQQKKNARKAVEKIKWLRNNDKDWVVMRKQAYIIGSVKSSKTIREGYESGRIKKQFGKENGFYGKQHSKETQQRIIEGLSNSQKGKGNSQFGTCWIHSHNLKKSIRIKKIDLDNYINEGWIKGMKQCYLNMKKNI